MALFVRFENLQFKLSLEPGYQPVFLLVKHGDLYGLAANPDLSQREVRQILDGLIEYLRTALPTN